MFLNSLKYKTLSLIVLTFINSLSVNAASAKEEIIVSAAASLTGVMKKIDNAFVEENPDVSVVFNFAATGALLQQIKMGAPVDVFLSANTEFMDRAEKKNLTLKKTRTDFASGRLVLVVPSDSTLTASGLNDLLTQDIKRIAIGNSRTVPAGMYAKKALIHSDLWNRIQDKLIIANSARQVLDYTIRGEVDAGFVYAADAVSTDKVKRVLDIINTGKITYPVAVVAGTKNLQTSQRFIDFLLSDKGREILASSGFNSEE